MKKFKTCKEILLCPEFKVLAFDLMRSQDYYRDGDFLNKEELIENEIGLFVDRKLKQLKMEGV
jgi:hypothetical protein